MVGEAGNFLGPLLVGCLVQWIGVAGSSLISAAFAAASAVHYAAFGKEGHAVRASHGAGKGTGIGTGAPSQPLGAGRAATASAANAALTAARWGRDALSASRAEAVARLVEHDSAKDSTRQPASS